ncbi:helix-turn-helix domain-containing protein [Streptomyces sp. NPDC057302]|uniref:winged helix-turn-helix domain-containing protein n=1 Tax=Streptomyces sp. NPDC057302 TaxID=3346094 RepID=UPI0036363A34
MLVRRKGGGLSTCDRGEVNLDMAARLNLAPATVPGPRTSGEAKPTPPLPVRRAGPGADDYVVKPASAADSGPATLGDLEIDRGALIVRKQDEELPLAPSELKLLLFLSAAPEQSFSRRQLLEDIWEHSHYGDARLVDACVRRLRAKIEEYPRCPVYVQTVRGSGYRFGPLPS